MTDPIYKFNFDKKTMDKLKGFVSSNVIIKVGVLGKSPERNDGINAVALATIHEFGAPNANIPERSFLRKTVFNYSDKISGDVIRAKNKLMELIAANGENIFYNQIGIKMVGYVHDTFKAEGPGWEPLKPLTIKLRARNKKRARKNTNQEKYPILRDTSQMMRSIMHEVVKE